MEIVVDDTHLNHAMKALSLVGSQGLMEPSLVRISADITNGTVKFESPRSDMSVVLTLRDGVTVAASGQVLHQIPMLTAVAGQVPSDEKLHLRADGEDARSTTITWGRVRIEVQHDAGDRWCAPKPVQGTRGVPLDGELFSDSVRRVAMAASKDQQQVRFTGVMLDGSNGQARFLAADGTRVACQVLPDNRMVPDGTSTMVSAAAIQKIARWVGTLTDAQVRLHPSADDLAFAVHVESEEDGLHAVFRAPCNVLEEPPQYDRVIVRDPNVSKASVTVDAEELIEAVNVMQAVTDNLQGDLVGTPMGLPTVTFVAEGDDLVVGTRADQAASGDVRVRIRASEGDTTRPIANHVKLLKDAVRSLGEGLMRVEWVTDPTQAVTASTQSATLFEGVALEGYQHLVMPITAPRRR